MDLVFQAGARLLKGVSPLEDFSFNITENPIITGGGVTASQTVKDANLNTVTGSGVANNFIISVSESKTVPGHSINAIDPAVATVDAMGNVSHVSDGTARFDVVTSVGTRRYSRAMSSGAGSSVQVASWQAGSLAAHIQAAIAGYVAGKTAGMAAQAVYSSYSGTIDAPNFTRNANLFTGALDLTAITAMTTATNSDTFPAVLVTPRHIMTGHVFMGVGTKVVFRTATGYVAKTVMAYQALNNGTSNSVAVLDSDVVGITPMKLLPQTWAAYLPSLATPLSGSPLWVVGPFMPVLNKAAAGGDRIRVLEARKATGITGYYDSSLNLGAYAPSLAGVFAGWTSDIIGGDSDGTVFAPINGAPVLLGNMNTSVGCSMYAAMLPSIQAAADALTSGQGLSPAAYQVQTVDLTGFNVY